MTPTGIEGLALTGETARDNGELPDSAMTSPSFIDDARAYSGERCPIDDFERQIACAIGKAVDAGKFDVVAALAGELRARRTA